MIDSKHTPGPWVTFVDRSSGEDRFDILPAMREGEIAQDIRNPADAALIQSAPNLLKVLQAIKRWGELGCVDVSGPGYLGGKKPTTKDVWQFPRHMLPDVDAAIAEATGESK